MGVTLGLWRSTESLMNDFDDPASVISAISVVRSSFLDVFRDFKNPRFLRDRETCIRQRLHCYLI